MYISFKYNLECTKSTSQDGFNGHFQLLCMAPARTCPSPSNEAIRSHKDCLTDLQAALLLHSPFQVSVRSGGSVKSVDIKRNGAFTGGLNPRRIRVDGDEQKVPLDEVDSRDCVPRIGSVPEKNVGKPGSWDSSWLIWIVVQLLWDLMALLWNKGTFGISIAKLNSNIWGFGGSRMLYDNSVLEPAVCLKNSKLVYGLPLRVV